MTKIRLHPSMLEFRGAMGDMLFRQRNGQVYVSIKPKSSGTEPSEAQVAQRQKFRAAVAYARAALAEESTRVLYEAAAMRKGVATFSLCVQDFLNAPVIERIQLAAYHGQIGDAIQILTTDELAVTSVIVQVSNPQGEEFESGPAMETVAGSGQWVYTASTLVEVGTPIQIQVTATDRPGGVTVSNANKTL